MPHEPVLTTVIGSYPFPGWLEVAADNLGRFGPDDLEEAQRDATLAAVMDQVRAGLDVITDGEQGRFDFNLSFYAFVEGLDLEQAPGRRLGPPGHDQRGRHRITGELRAPRGLGGVDEYRRLVAVAPEGPRLKASVPGPYTLAGRIVPGGAYADRWAVTEALVPIVARELEALVEAGCTTITLDEPSMSCYAYREDPARMVDVFNRTAAPVRGRCYLGTHLCFGNYKARAASRREYAPMFPAFLDLAADELHLEMASREFAELDVAARVAEVKDVGIGIIDVKSLYVETPEDVAARIRRCLQVVPAERLSVSPDCGLSQTPRWAARRKLEHLAAGARAVRESL
jgi:5-methyltetrahydropteroyltriglutamate--homocysteine methyltransferase